MDVRDRLENAFTTAEQYLGVPRLIDAEGLLIDWSVEREWFDNKTS